MSRATFEPTPPRRPEGYDEWTSVGGTGTGYGPPSEAHPIGFAPPKPKIEVVKGYRKKVT